MRRLGVLPILGILLSHPLSAATLADEVEAFLNVVAVHGRENEAAEFILGRLAGLPASRDALGNVVLTVGSGEPRRLAACSLGEPGFIVSGIREDGYVQVVPAGNWLAGALWTQSHEGQTVVLGGSKGWTPGAVALPSVHLQQEDGGGRERPFSMEDLYIDVGAESAAEVAEAEIRLMDPVALIRRPSRLAGGLVAASHAAVKGSCIALADAARRYQPVGPAGGTGTVVFAWTVQDGFNQAGLFHLVRDRASFQDVLLLHSRGDDLPRGREAARGYSRQSPGRELHGRGRYPFPSSAAGPHGDAGRL
jgi:putative aminopeptidase FrvX